MGKVVIEKDTKFDKGDIVLVSNNKTLYICKITDYAYDHESDTIMYEVKTSNIPPIKYDYPINFTLQAISENQIIGVLEDTFLDKLKE